MHMKPPKVEVRFRRDLGLLDVTMIGIGAMTGASIFILAGLATSEVGPAILAVIVLSFVVTILTAMSYAELAGAFPEAGGGYLWIKEGLPHPFGFVGGWISWFGHSIACSFYTVVFGTGIVWLLDGYDIRYPFGMSETIAIKVCALLVLLIFLAINYFGTKHTGKAGDAITFIQLGLVGVFVFFALKKSIENPDFSSGFVPFLPNGIDSVLIGMGLFVIAFEGYEIIAQCAEETKNPEKTLPRAIFISVGFVTLLYFLVLVSAIGATGWEFLAGKTAGHDSIRSLSEVARIVMPWGIGGTVMIVAMLIGTMATLNATTFSSSRISFAMARDGALPRAFSRIHRKRRTPHISIIASGAIIGIMAVFLPIRDIAAGADIMFILLFIFVNASIIVLRFKRPDLKRSYKIPLFPLTPILALVTLVALGISIFWFSPIAWYIAIAWIEGGLIVYLLAGGKKDIEKAKPEEFLKLVERRPKPRRHHVMVAVAGEKAAPLVRIGAQLSGQAAGEISIVNVLETPKNLPPSAIGYSEVSPRMRLVKRLERVARSEKTEASSTVLISRNIADSLLEEADNKKADIVLLGWRGTSGKGRAFGSTIDSFVARARCDVIVAKTESLRTPINSILIIAGNEWHASYAAEVAAIVAEHNHSEVVVLGMAQSDRQMETVKVYSDRLANICRSRGVRVSEKIMVTKNIINTAICEADEHDLVVMGASEVVWAPSFVLMGLVEDKIAKGTTKPVIMVRKVKNQNTNQENGTPN